MSVELTFLTRPGCGLCVTAMDVIEDTLGEHIAAGDVTVTAVDIETDADLLAQHEWDIPVVLLNGRRHAKHRIDGTRLRRTIETLLARG